MHKTGFSNYLKWLRKEFKLTQQQLAEMIDCAISTIARLEAGKELPSRRIFMKLDSIFESIGIIYDELWMESVFGLKAARKELLMAIKKGRGDEIEKKLEKFRCLMEECEEENDEEEKRENMQYYTLGHLISIRKRGLSVEQFLDEIIQTFELRRKIPDYRDLPNVKLSQVEYQIFYEISEAYRIMGDIETAELICRGLLANELDPRSPFMVDKYLETSFALAKVCMMKNDYSTVKQCLEYIFTRYLSDNDTRTLFHSLMIQMDVCESIGDRNGADIIRNFLNASKDLVEFMNGTLVKI
ncbi:DNA-binding transcriptional regulator, XRE-family HTH domain [Pseudobutyrivibrio sp. UC1225]|uniref:helix-turn-helix transcriptional regulator n=1 Tax=Pseudobutyrivibrio sp. UC1225 TaxID=1798185 RepID=UPI0008E095CB|nr:helix-turn-helix transcriptional regulator [Pseudobutyrivibrio sp. UC1225]SFO22952.1 DNA-binding transcriptional regulator, XRE-family HTH domain [Pseudobutyrivibrio sp. UC1225]